MEILMVIPNPFAATTTHRAVCSRSTVLLHMQSENNVTGVVSLKQCY